jgi:hypothetical protein
MIDLFSLFIVDSEWINTISSDWHILFINSDTFDRVIDH